MQLALYIAVVLVLTQGFLVLADMALADIRNAGTAETENTPAISAAEFLALHKPILDKAGLTYLFKDLPSSQLSKDYPSSPSSQRTKRRLYMLPTGTKRRNTLPGIKRVETSLPRMRSNPYGTSPFLKRSKVSLFFGLEEDHGVPARRADAQTEAAARPLPAPPLPDVADPPPASAPLNATTPSPPPPPVAPPAGNNTDADTTVAPPAAVKAEPFLSTAVTTMYCVAYTKTPVPQVRVIPNQADCSNSPWIHFFTFLALNQPQKGLSQYPWSAFEKIRGSRPPLESLLEYKKICAVSRDWKSVASGYAHAKYNGNKVYLTRTRPQPPSGKKETHLWIDPYKPWSAPGYIPDSKPLNVAGIFYVATQMEVDVTFLHMQKFPSLYERSNIQNNGTLKGTVFNRSILLGAQIVVDHLPALELKRPTPNDPSSTQDTVLLLPNLSKDFSTAGLSSFKNRYRAIQKPSIQEIDGTTRQSMQLIYYPKPGGMGQWMGGITAPVGRSYKASLIRSAFSEAVRRQTSVRLDVAPNGRILIVPVPWPSSPRLIVFASHHT